MKNDSCDSSAHEQARPAHPAREGRPHSAPGATVSIPFRPAAEPLGPATLRARLALLRPQPLRLRAAPRTDV